MPSLRALTRAASASRSACRSGVSPFMIAAAASDSLDEKRRSSSVPRKAGAPSDVTNSPRACRPAATEAPPSRTPGCGARAACDTDLRRGTRRHPRPSEGKTPPTVHELRSLSLRLYHNQGINAQEHGPDQRLRRCPGDEWIKVNV